MCQIFKKLIIRDPICEHGSQALTTLLSIPYETSMIIFNNTTEQNSNIKYKILRTFVSSFVICSQLSAGAARATICFVIMALQL